LIYGHPADESGKLIKPRRKTPPRPAARLASLEQELKAAQAAMAGAGAPPEEIEFYLSLLKKAHGGI
jgi:hypothetical protein